MSNIFKNCVTLESKWVPTGVEYINDCPAVIGIRPGGLAVYGIIISNRVPCKNGDSIKSAKIIQLREHHWSIVNGEKVLVPGDKYIYRVTEINI